MNVSSQVKFIVSIPEYRKLLNYTTQNYAIKYTQQNYTSEAKNTIDLVY